jgi:hypothetical protein
MQSWNTSVANFVNYWAVRYQAKKFTIIWRFNITLDLHLVIPHKQRSRVWAMTDFFHCDFLRICNFFNFQNL